MIGGIIGGVVGGVIGALVWGGIAYGTGYELGFVAWAIGGLVGIATALGARGKADDVTGIAAAVIALAAVCGGKWLAVTWTFEKALGGVSTQMQITDEDMKSAAASDKLEQMESSNQKLTWPAGKNAENIEAFADYPAEVRAAVEKDWAAATPEERERVRKEREDEMNKLLAGVMSGIKQEGFLQSFGMFDIVFGLLAVATAFQLGKGGS